MKKIKKILIVGKNPPPHYGTSVWFQTLQQNAWPPHFEIHFFDNNTHSSLQSVGKWSFKRLFLTFNLFEKFKLTLKMLQPDLVLVPVSQSGIGFLKDSFFIRKAKKRNKTMIILHGSNWQNWLDSSPKSTQNMVKNTLKGTVGVIVLGEKLKSLFTDYYRKEQIFSVPNGITDSYHAIDKSPNPKPIITYLGNLQAGKGIKELIQACALLKNRDYSLQLIGVWRDTETETFCSHLIEKHQLPVEFLGPKFGQEKIKILSRSDLFVFAPSQAEGHPLVILEAMSCCLPVITTNRGAISETVIDGEQGFVLENPEPEALAQALRKLLADQNLRKTFGTAARKRFLEHYTDVAMIERYAGVFERVL